VVKLSFKEYMASNHETNNKGQPEPVPEPDGSMTKSKSGPKQKPEWIVVIRRLSWPVGSKLVCVLILTMNKIKINSKIQFSTRK
jgi:hypothetical protein